MEDFKLNIQQVPGDGDCLFYSVAHILRNWYLRKAEGGGGVSEAGAESVPDLESFCKYLRSKVALRVLDESDAQCSDMIQTWHKLWRDAVKEKDMEMIHEMKHMLNVLQPTSTVDRRVLFKNMLDPSIYWGDEFALQSMEDFLGCMFVVVNDRFAFVQRQYKPETLLTPRWISMLLLRGCHYEALQDNSGKFCWSLEELPSLIQDLIGNFRSAL